MASRSPPPRRRRKSPRVEERRNRIVERTRQLVAERGIDELTIRDLADECGVAVATLYNQFGSREGVIGAISSFAPDAPCNCYFETIATKATPDNCKSCEDDTECGGDAPKCRHGYCEAY